jgi:hypothetical protein
MPGRLTAVPVDRQHGLPFLTATQVFDIRPKARKWLAAAHTPELETRYGNDGDILLTRSGTVGEAIIYYAAHKGSVLSDDLLRITSNTQALGFLYSFLKSRYGRAMMKSTKYGNIIKHLEPEHVEDLPIPQVGQDIRDDLNLLVRETFHLRDQAFALTEKAEILYVEGLGLRSERLALESSFEIPASETFDGNRRLDGFFYNPEAEAALHALRGTGHRMVLLDSVVDRVFGVPRFKHIYTSGGIPYLDSEDLFKVNPEIEKFIPPTAKKNAEAYFVRKGWLLMACSGQLYGLNGSVVLADAWHEGKIVSNHVIRIVPDDENGLCPAYLQVALGHPVYGRPLVLRSAFGTEVPEIAPEDVRQIPVVEPPSDLEKEISRLVEKAVSLRAKADAKEAEAIGSLEKALEEAIGPPAK